MLEEIEKTIGFTFKNKEFLKKALIHKSYNEGLQKNLPHNEKLEFLGDSVINLAITEYLYKKYQNLNEGDLSKIKAHLVSTDFLYFISNSLQLQDHIFLGKGEEKNNGRSNKKIIASLFEAVVGAIYLDSNFKTTTTTIIPFFKEFLEKNIEDQSKINDYKSELQEIIQKKENILPEYDIVNKTGQPPRVVFTASVSLNGKEIGRGKGQNKRQAEQSAAYQALKKNNDFLNYTKISEVFFLKND